MCEQQLENYEKCTSKVERSTVIHRIVLSVMAGSPSQTGFVNRDKATGRWHFIGMTRARERVGYVLRRAIADKKANKEKAKLGVPSLEKKKKKTTKKAKNQVTKKQEQTGIAWHVAPRKLSASSDKQLDATAAKSLAMRRRKLPIGLTNSKMSSLLSSNQEEKEPQQKRQKTCAKEDDTLQSAVLSQALSIAKPSAAEISFPLGAAAASSSLLRRASLLGSTTSGLSSSLYGKHDIYLEAAIREHLSESSAIRELALRERAADAVLRERIALRERAAMQERLALQEETMLRERIKMHEDAALRERLALQERLNQRKAQDKPVTKALQKKTSEATLPSSSSLSAAQALTGASSLYSSAALLGPTDPLRLATSPKYSLYPGLPGYPPIL